MNLTAHPKERQTMRWLALQFETTHDASELIADYLADLGAAGIQVEDAAEIRAILADPASLAYADDDFLDNLDEWVRIQAYFAEYDQGIRCRPAGANTSDGLLTAGGLYTDDPWTYEPLDRLEERIRTSLAGFAENLPIGRGYTGWQEIHEEDWADSWKQYYQTLHLTRRLVINPSWISYEAAPDEIVIRLDPGSAFGTGTHETTALCAELLNELVKPGDRVLDLGTGSGILAIIAGRLGAVVEAIDIDPLAVRVAKENCTLNQVDVDCHAGELRDAHGKTYDIVVANIIADVICMLAADIPGKLAGGGLFIASGIIGTKLERVLDTCRDAGLELLACRERGDWRAALFRRLA
jgi:ribosomal protein L11 methyltransferase